MISGLLPSAFVASRVAPAEKIVSALTPKLKLAPSPALPPQSSDR